MLSVTLLGPFYQLSAAAWILFLPRDATSLKVIWLSQPKYVWLTHLVDFFGCTNQTECLFQPNNDVNKDWTCKDKDKDQAYKDQDKDKDKD